MTDTQQLQAIAVKVGRLEVLQEANTRAVSELASSVNKLVDKLDQSDNIAREADQRARSAHHRLDDLQTAQRWLIGTTVTMVLSVVGMLIKFI